MVSASELAGILDELRAGSERPLLDRDPVRRAAAELADWLSHDEGSCDTEEPSLPDQLEHLESRTLEWPATGERETVHAFRWSRHPPFGLEPSTTGIGVVGTNVGPQADGDRHTLGDVLALVCVAECTERAVVSQRECHPELRLEGRYELPGGRPATDAKPVFRLDVHEGLVPDRPSVFVCTVRGEDGFFVADGAKSRWYPMDPRATDSWRESWTIGRIHLGRSLLGLAAGAIVREPPPEAVSDAVFEERFRAALAATAGLHVDPHPLGSFEPVGRHVERYAALLEKRGAIDELRSLVETLASRWDHNAGYAALTDLSFRAADRVRARAFAEKLAASYPHHYRSAAMAVLARVEHAEGNTQRGIRLLEECIARIEADTSCRRHEKDLFSEPHRRALAELRGTGAG